MFKSRYWREYPVFMQLMLLLLQMFSLGFLFIAIAQVLVPKIFGVDILSLGALNELSPRNVVDAAMFVQLLSAMGVFLIPALIFSYFVHPKPLQYLGLKNTGKPVQWLLVIGVMLGAMPLFIGIVEFFKMFEFGNEVQKIQERNEDAFKAFLDMPSFGSFLAVFVILAIMPAISEELIFRGILMRLMHKRSKRIGYAIAISSFIFAIVHFNPYGAFSIFLAAVLIGSIYYLTGSLWMSMLAHLLNNGLQIIVIYLGNDNAVVKNMVDSDSLPPYFYIAGAILFGISFFLLWRNRTPLPDSWSDDFTADELMERER